MGKLFKIALVLFVVGVASVVVFASLSDYKVFATVDEDDFEYQELIYDADEFTSFDFDFINRAFVIRNSEDNQIRIEFYTTDIDQVEVTTSESTLTLENDIEWYNQLFTGWNLFVSDEYYRVNVYLPSSMDYDLDIETTNGDFDVADMDNFSSLYLKATNGEIKVDQVSGSDLDFGTSNGTVSLTDVSSSNYIDVHTTNGSIYLTDVDADEIDASTTNGIVIGVQVTSEDIRFDSTNGRIELEVVGDKDDFEVFMDTTNGDMIYDGIEVSQEHFNTDGIYVIELDTTNGDVELSFKE